jgi:hypothetical protein
MDDISDLAKPVVSSSEDISDLAKPATSSKPEKEAWIPGGAGGIIQRTVQGVGGLIGGAVKYATQDLPRSISEFVNTPKEITTPDEATGAIKGAVSTIGSIPGVLGNLVGVVSPRAGRAINSIITNQGSETLQPKNPEQEHGFQYGQDVTGLGAMALPIPSGAGALVKAPDVVAGALTSGLSKVPLETLRAASSPEGRAAIAAQAGKEAEIGQNVVHVLQNAPDYLPQREEIASALQTMPDVNINSMTNKILEKASAYKTPELKAVGDKLVDQAESLSQLADPSGNIPASQLWDYRKQLDQTLYGAKTGELGTGEYVSQLKGLRDDIRQSLIGASEGTPYAGLMNDAFTKFNAIDKMKKMLGKNETTQEAQAESFIRNINNAGKTQQQEWLNNFQNVFNTEDFSGQAKLAQQARQLGESKGGSNLFSQSPTGRSGLGTLIDIATGKGIGAGTVLSSPLIATRAVLPTTQALAKTAPIASALARPFYPNRITQGVNALGQTGLVEAGQQ